MKITRIGWSPCTGAACRAGRLVPVYPHRLHLAQRHPRCPFRPPGKPRSRSWFGRRRLPVYGSYPVISCCFHRPTMPLFSGSCVCRSAASCEKIIASLVCFRINVIIDDLFVPSTVSLCINLSIYIFACFLKAFLLLYSVQVELR